MSAIVTLPCWYCHKRTTLDVTDAQIARYRAGDLVQNVFPHWSPERRELLKTGVHPACWNELFGDPT